MKKIIPLLIPLFLAGILSSQQLGKITGIVMNTEGLPLSDAKIIVSGTSYGAVADADGRYFINYVPAGNYTVQFKSVGYTTTDVSNVVVSNNIATRLDQSLPKELIAGQRIKVIAKRPLIQKDKTSSINVITANDIENLPIRNANELIATVPGVVVQDDKLYIRGGRDNEVAYFVNGIPTTSFGSRKNLIYIPQEATEEIQVQVGGYDASAGGANSGVITRQIKRGSNKFKGNFSIQADGTGLGNEFLNSRSYGHRLLTGTFSGPIIKDKIKFFTSIEKKYQDDPIRWGGKEFEFLNRADQEPGNLYYSTYMDTFDLVWPGYHQTNDNFTNYIGNITFDFSPLVNNLSIVYTKEKTHKNGTTWMESGSILGVLRDHGTTIYPAVEDPAEAYSVTIPGREGCRLNNSLFISNELSFQISPKNHLNLNLGYLTTNSEDNDEWFENDWKKWYDGEAIQDYLGFDESIWTPFRNRYREKNDYRINGFLIARPGTAPDWVYTKTKTSQISANGSFTSVLNNHTISAGFNWRKSTVRRLDINTYGIIYAADPQYGYENYGIATYGYWENVPIDFKRMYVDGYGYDLDENEIDERKIYGYGEDVTYIDGPKKPSELGLFLQDKFEFDDIVLNAGIRLDILNTDDETLIYPDSVKDYDESSYIRLDNWEKVDPYVYVQPRLGISLPVSDKTQFHGFFGKFAQLPDLNSTWYSAYDYRSQIPRGGYYYLDPVGFGLEPVTTTKYEMGFAQQVSENATIEITAFHKEQKGLITTERNYYDTGETDYWGLPEYIGYNRRINGDKSITKGIEFKYTLRRTNRLAGYANYTYSITKGTGSDALSNLATVDRGLERTNIMWPVNHNRPHVGSVLFDYRFADNDGGPIFENLGINVLLNFSSGHNYTPIIRPVGG